MEGLTVSLNCPACGGAVKMQEGESALNCQYCGSTLFIEGDQGVQTIAFKNKMTPGTVMAAAEAWWRKGFKARDLKRVGKVTEVYPIYIPFWHTDAKVVGWVCGYEERHRTGSKGEVYTEKIPRETMVFDDYHYSAIACDPGDLGIRSLRNESGEKVLEDFEMIPTFETTSSVDDAIKLAENEAIAWGRNKARVPHITFERLHAFPKSMSIIYYPIWVVRYSYRERMYLITVDGITGQVLSGRAPGDPLFQSLAVTLGSALGGIVAGGGLLLSVAAETEVAIVGLVVGGVIFYLAYRFFRHGSEIVEGEFEGKRGLQKDQSPVQMVQDVMDQLGGLGGLGR